jgi:hypothetical protein
MTHVLALQQADQVPVPIPIPIPIPVPISSLLSLICCIRTN